MAVYCSAAGLRYEIADHADLTLPASDWCMGMWTRPISDTETFPGIASNNAYSVNNSFDIFRQASTDKYYAQVEDGDGTTTGDISPSGTLALDAWGLLILQRRDADSQIQFYLANYGAAATVVTATTTGQAACNGAAWWIGEDRDGPSLAHMAELFFMNSSSLSTEEIAALADGANILNMRGPDLTLYHPLYTAVATSEDIIGAHDATRTGSTPSTVEHAPVNLDAGVIYSQAPAVAGGLSIPIAYHHYRAMMGA